MTKKSHFFLMHFHKKESNSMGYYANCSGEIIFNKKLDGGETEAVDAIFCDVFEDISWWDSADGNLYVSVKNGDAKYYSEEYDDAFFRFSQLFGNYIREGEVRFFGEDCSIWRYVFKNGCFIEECGTVIFEGDLALLSEAKNIIDKVIKRREI